MFWNRRGLRAMSVADGEDAARPGEDRAPDVDAFRRLSETTRAAVARGLPEPPPFDAMWSGVERRAREATAPSHGARVHWWRELLGRRPLLVLAPLGAAVLAVVLGLSLRPAEPVNRCYVDSYDAGSGSVVVDQDFDDPERPTVIWYVEEG